MIINTKVFLSKLEKVKTGCATKGDSESAKSFLMADNKLYSYSDKIFVSTTLPELDFEIQIASKTLFDYIKKVKDEEIELSLENNTLIIKAGKSTTKIAAETKVVVPSNLVEEGESHPLPSDFSEGVKSALFSVGSDITKTYLSAIKVEQDRIESTNNRTITRCQLDGEINDTIYIPDFASKHISTINPTHYSKSGNWLIFTNNDEETTFCCRTIDATGFPNLDSIFDRSMEFNPINFPKGFVDSLDRANVLIRKAKVNEQVVRIKSNGKEIKIEGGSSSGAFVDYISAEGVEEFEFCVGVSTLIDIMKKKPTIGISGNIMKVAVGNVVNLICLGK